MGRNLVLLLPENGFVLPGLHLLVAWKAISGIIGN
jgi:hypothetical protein